MERTSKSDEAYANVEGEESVEIHRHKKKKKKHKRATEDDYIVEEKGHERGKHKLTGSYKDDDVVRKKKKKKKRKEKQESSQSSSDDDIEDKKRERHKEEKKEAKVAEKDPTPAEATRMGQWSDANFDDSGRQEKFFRLLGGYKKKGDSEGLFKSKFANKAMGKTQEKSMEDRLESQFSQAMEKKRTSRGMGLGYSSATDPATKDFHIDKDHVKSIKFEAASEQ